MRKRLAVPQVSHYATHLQVQTRKESLEKYQWKGRPARAITHGFAGMLGDLDEAIGGILDAVSRLGISGRTYVILMADNGGRGVIPGADGSLGPPNRPLNGAKHSSYEGGIRVPFIVAGPGVKPNSICRTAVTGYDLLPTLYDLAGGRKPLPAEIDGGSFGPLLKNAGVGEVDRAFEGLVFHRPLRRNDPQSAIRVGDYKLLLKWKTGKRPRQALLFDLARDLSEQHDLSSEQPRKAAELERLLLEYLKSVNAESAGPAED